MTGLELPPILAEIEDVTIHLGVGALPILTRLCESIIPRPQHVIRQRIPPSPPPPTGDLLRQTQHRGWPSALGLQVTFAAYAHGTEETPGTQRRFRVRHR